MGSSGSSLTTYISLYCKVSFFLFLNNFLQDMQSVICVHATTNFAKFFKNNKLLKKNFMALKVILYFLPLNNINIILNNKKKKKEEI